MPKKNVIIIGAGIGGLATAALLGKEGYNVTILEKNDQVGGRAMVIKEKGFSFDMGPSWYLMPDAFEHFFALFGKKPSDLFKLHKLDPQYRIFFGKNDFVDIRENLQKNFELFESIEPGVTPKLKEYLRLAEYKYKVAMDKFVYKNYDSIFDFFNIRMAEGAKLNVFENLDKHVSRYVKNKRLKQILQYTNVFLGGSPKNTPALYSIMSHIDFNMGCYYPLGGIGKFIEALKKLCDENGVKIILNTEVTKIEVKDKKATEVITAHKTYNTEIVISNADYPFTETQLLKPQYQTYSESFWKKKTIAPSAFIMYLGIKGKIKNLQHHNLFFENDWEKHFDQIFENPTWPREPSYYICCPSKTDPTVAPKDCENIFVLVPVAAGLQDDDKTREKFSKQILGHLENLIGENITDRIVYKRIHSQRDYTQLYNSYKGTALGLSHTLFQSAIFRPTNKSKKVENLFYVGQYTTPGVGMPMCLISAELVAERVSNYKII